MPRPSARFKDMKQLINKLSRAKLSKASDAKDSRGDSPSGATTLESASLSTADSSAADLSAEASSIKNLRPESPSVKKQSDASTNGFGLKLPFAKNSKGTRVAFTLLLVRPWVLLVGFWLFSLVGASVAIEGLISPRRLTEALPETTQKTPVANSSLINVEQLSDDIVAADSAGDAEAKGSETGSEASGQSNRSAASERGSFPTRTLAVLVGTCAAGCLVISRRRAMVRLAAARSRNRKRRVHGGAGSAQSAIARKHSTVRKTVKPAGAKLASVTKLVTKAESSGLSSPKPSSKSKKRRQRNKRGTAQPVPLRTARNRPLVSRSTAQKNGIAKPARPRPVKRTPSRASNRQSVVSVVPANESNALDWENGSLAHDMDVRPQRAAM